MIVFVTGGTGRLGSLLVDYLRQRQETRVLDPGNALLPEKVIGIKGDLSDIKALEKGIAGCDVVFHLAGLIDYNADWRKLEEVNIQGTRNVVELCAKHKVRRLIFASSTAVYGKELKEQPANEETPTAPTDPYGKSKLEAERIVGEHFSDVPYTIFRPGVIYGPTYLTYYSKVFRAIQQGKMQILGDGKNIIPFVHAGDVADAMLKAAAYDSAKGKVYVLSGNQTLTQEQIYQIAAQALGVEFKKSYMNPAVAKAMLSISSIFSKSSITAEDIDVLSSNRVFDTTRAESDLKWAPMPLETGIKQLAELYKEKLLEAKKRKYLEYQREMIKQGKFVTSFEKPVPAEEVKQNLQPEQPVIQSPAPVSKPKYFQPMPKPAVTEAAKPVQQQVQQKPQSTTQQPIQQAQTTFFGFPISAPKKQEKSQSQTTSFKPEAGSEKYSSALSRMAPVIPKDAGKEPPKPPPSVLKFQSQSQQPPQQRPAPPTAQPSPQAPVAKPAQGTSATTQSSAGKPVVGAGRSWLDSVLKDIKKESDKKDDTNK